MSRKRWKDRLGLAVLPVLARLLLPLYWKLCPIRKVLGQERLDGVDGIVAAGDPVIACYWHQMHFMSARLLRRLNRRGFKFASLVSPSTDGEYAARLGRSWGFEIVRASSSRTGAQAMRDLYQIVKKRGLSPIMTNDGPRGPLHVFQPGAIMLAQMTGAPIVPLAYAAKRAWNLRSWDRFIVPKPFSPVVFAVGEPRYVPRELTLKEVEPIQRELEATMAELIASAERALLS